MTYCVDATERKDVYRYGGIYLNPHLIGVKWVSIADNCRFVLCRGRIRWLLHDLYAFDIVIVVDGLSG